MPQVVRRLLQVLGVWSLNAHEVSISVTPRTRDRRVSSSILVAATFLLVHICMYKNVFVIHVCCVLFFQVCGLDADPIKSRQQLTTAANLMCEP